MARAAALIGLYLATGIAFVIAVNEDQDNIDILFFVVAAAAIVLGWASGKWGWRGPVLWITLPWVLVLLGLQFETTNKSTGGGECCYEVYELAVFPTIASVILMVLAGGSRIIYEAFRRRGAGS
jgi:hypothetical protein